MGKLKVFICSVWAMIFCTSVLPLAGCKTAPELDTLDTTLVYTKHSETNYASFKKISKDGTVSDGAFKILCFTDLHLQDNYSPATLITLTIIERHIQKEKPDLVVITGDVCLGGSATEAQIALNNVFERNKQYYAVVLGNHEGEGGPSRKEQIETYSEFPYCLTQMGPDNIYGYGNFIINIEGSEGKINKSLIFIDSGDYVTKENCEKYEFKYKDGYDFIKPDQINWYKENLNNIKSLNNDVMPQSALFMHIPFPEYTDAYTALSDKNNPEKACLIYGQKLENVCSSRINSGMFDAIKEIASTKFAICGHDHINDYSIEYEGVKLTYSQSLSYSSYFLRSKGNILSALTRLPGSTVYFPDGTTCIILSDDGINSYQLLNQLNADIFDGLDEHIAESNINLNTLPKSDQNFD